MSYKVAIVGATGNVGREMLNVLNEREFPVGEVYALASARSAGRPVSFGESVKGASIAAVCEPSDPSTNPFSAPMCSHLSPLPRAATVSRKRSQVLIGTAA